MTSCPTHGKSYQAGCFACAESKRMCYRSYAKQCAATGPQLVDARPVVAHVRKLLSAGSSQAAIARAADLSGPFISMLISGSFVSIHRTRANALLALTAADAAGMDRFIPAQPIVRRLQHLIWMGWSQSAIGAGTGIPQQSIATLMSGERRRISRERAALILDFYRQHWQEDGGSVRARNTARRNGWVSIMAWDNPDEVGVSAA